MRTIKMLSGVLSVTLATVAANAAPMTYECDTPADRISEIKVPVNIVTFRMSGIITADAFRVGKYWPVGNISLVDLEGNAVRLRLVAAKDRTTSDIFLETTKEKKPLKRKLGQLPIGQPLNFSINASDPGKVKITVNELDLDATVNSELSSEAFLSISCSTGEFNFSNLEWSEK